MAIWFLPFQVAYCESSESPRKADRFERISMDFFDRGRLSGTLQLPTRRKPDCMRNALIIKRPHRVHNGIAKLVKVFYFVEHFLNWGIAWVFFVGIYQPENAAEGIQFLSERLLMNHGDAMNNNHAG